MDWLVATGNRLAHQMAVFDECEFSLDYTKSKTLEKAKYIFDYNVQYDRINRLSNRAFKSRPVLSWVLKNFVKYLFKNDYTLTNENKRRNLKTPDL